MRWLAFVGQLVLVYLANREASGWGVVASYTLVGLTAASNAALELARRRTAWVASSRAVGVVLTLDTLLLTGLLAANGGATNPFSVMYIVYIALASVLLGARWTTFVACLSIGAFAALFFLPGGAESPHQHHHGGDSGQFSNHVRGMWLAFTLAAALVAYFVRAIAATIAQQRNEIEALREAAARTARLASLSTLSAGAAHELGSPLGTIAVAAREIEVAAGSATPDVAPDLAGIESDARLVLSEVERCRSILLLMAGRATDSADAVTVEVASLDALLHQRLDAQQGARVALEVAPSARAVTVPKERTLQALHALSHNALAASAPPAPVTVTATATASELRFEVRDHGSGMDPAVLARAGEPFFTTREPGRGLGLGLFLVRAFAESLGGSLALTSAPGAGTTALITLPLTAGRVRG